MHRRAAALRIAVAVLIGAAPAGACGPGAAAPTTAPPVAEVIPVIVSPVLTVGRNRLLYSTLDRRRSEPAARPDRVSTIRLLPPGAAATRSGAPPASAGDHAASPGASAAAIASRFIWTIDDQSGLYVAQADFDRPGEWTAEIALAGPGVSAPPARVAITVVERRSGVTIGSPAPRLAHPTLASVGGDARRLTTDVQPEPRFYEHSIAELLDDGQPFVVLFGSPGFCTNGTCGPTMARLKSAARANPSIAFVHIEAYAEQVVDGRLEPLLDAKGNLQPSAELLAYGLPTETSVVVVDRFGRVHEILDVIIGSGEVEAAIASLP